MSRTHKKFLKLNNKKINNPIKMSKLSLKSGLRQPMFGVVYGFLFYFQRSLFKK
jgi:hypothetical protein